MKKILILLICCVAFVCAEAVGQTPKVTTSISADTVWIGDQVLLQVDIEKDIASQLGLPEFKDGKITEKLEIIGVPTVDTISKDGRSIKLRVNYTITSFEPGSYVLQGFPFVLEKANGEVDTLEAHTVNYLYVKTFDIDTTKQEIFDIKQPIHTPLLFSEIKEYVMWGSLAAIILAVMIYFFVKWRKNRKLALINRPKEPAHIIAMRALDVLQNKKMWQSGNVKEYYSVLSDILRQYLEHRYEIGAMEMTSDEILDAIKELNSTKIIGVLKPVLIESDLVKFAKWAPQPNENEEAWQTVFNYVEATKIMVQTTDQIQK